MPTFSVLLVLMNTFTKKITPELDMVYKETRLSLIKNSWLTTFHKMFIAKKVKRNFKK